MRSSACRRRPADASRHARGQSKAISRTPAARPVHAERLTEVAAETVLEHERETMPFVAVMETHAVAIEDRHRVDPSFTLEPSTGSR